MSVKKELMKLILIPKNACSFTKQVIAGIGRGEGEIKATVSIGGDKYAVVTMKRVGYKTN